MKLCIALIASVWMSGYSAPARGMVSLDRQLAAGCSPLPARCRACTNCHACKYCTSGGKCSVCIRE